MEEIKEPNTIVLLNFVKPTKGISSNEEKNGVAKSTFNKKNPIWSKTGSNSVARNENKTVEITKKTLLILKNTKKTVNKIHKALSFGKKPSIIPQQTAWAISPGWELLLIAFNILIIKSNITLTHKKKSHSVYTWIKNKTSFLLESKQSNHPSV